jgi:hypothetical protein
LITKKTSQLPIAGDLWALITFVSASYQQSEPGASAASIYQSKREWRCMLCENSLLEPGGFSVGAAALGVLQSPLFYALILFLP